MRLRLLCCLALILFDIILSFKFLIVINRVDVLHGNYSKLE